MGSGWAISPGLIRVFGTSGKKFLVFFSVNLKQNGLKIKYSSWFFYGYIFIYTYTLV